MSKFWEYIDKLLSESEIVVERSKGSAHPVWKRIYPVDYSYLKGATSTDGNGVDVCIGSCGKSSGSLHG